MDDNIENKFIGEYAYQGGDFPMRIPPENFMQRPEGIITVPGQTARSLSMEQATLPLQSETENGTSCPCAEWSHEPNIPMLYQPFIGSMVVITVERSCGRMERICGILSGWSHSFILLAVPPKGRKLLCSIRNILYLYCLN